MMDPQPKGRAGSRSMEDYNEMGYTSAPMEKHLKDFIELYAIGGDKQPGCKAECIEICQINALQDLDDLRNLSRRCWLGEYFPAKVALRFENALESPEMLNFFKKLDEGNKKPWANTFYFTYSIESMESTCATYGILSALLLTMNVGSFGAIEIEEWGAFESGVAMERCNGTSLFRWSSGRPGETVEECITALSAESEKWFIMANFGASLFLILTLLFSSWLYIAFGIPGADPLGQKRYKLLSHALAESLPPSTSSFSFLSRYRARVSSSSLRSRVSVQLVLAGKPDGI